MKNKLIIFSVSSLLVVSLIANYLLLESSVKGAYAIEFKSRLTTDTQLLAALINTEITKQELLQLSSQQNPDIKVVASENRRSQWDTNGPAYPHAIKLAGNMTFFFDAESRLVRVDHWLNNISPLYERRR